MPHSSPFISAVLGQAVEARESLYEIRQREKNMMLACGIAIAAVIVIWLVVRRRSSRR